MNSLQSKLNLKQNKVSFSFLTSVYDYLMSTYSEIADEFDDGLYKELFYEIHTNYQKLNKRAGSYAGTFVYSDVDRIKSLDYDDWRIDDYSKLSPNEVSFTNNDNEIYSLKDIYFVNDLEAFVEYEENVENEHAAKRIAKLEEKLDNAKKEEENRQAEIAKGKELRKRFNLPANADVNEARKIAAILDANSDEDKYKAYKEGIRLF